MRHTSEANSAAKNVELYVDNYSEVMLSIRHYSNLRFAMLTVFVAATAALIAASFGTEVLPAADTTLRVAFHFAGLVLTVAFFWLEVVLDSYLKAFSKVADALKRRGHWRTRPGARKYLWIPIRVLLYAGVALFWAFALICGPYRIS